MKIVLFYHSLVSDWNHGNAHFLRGVCKELIRQGHTVNVYEPERGWSYFNLLKDKGESVVGEFSEYYPQLRTNFYRLGLLNLDVALAGADLVIVHEFNPVQLIRKIGEHKARTGGYKLLFHDTHHRSASDPGQMKLYDLSQYDGVLAFGNVIRDFYRGNTSVEHVWTWHEAADTDLFRPVEGVEKTGDLVWVGNWGDEERTKELHAFLIEPVRELRLKATIYGVRYPAPALEALKRSKINYKGYLPNFKVPEVFARYRVTMHVPRRPYALALPGIPTIRPFEAMACGIPLISAPWADTEGLFNAGTDYLPVRTKKEAKEALSQVLSDPSLAKSLSEHALGTIRSRHTCRHRVSELMRMCRQMGIKAHVKEENPA